MRLWPVVLACAALVACSGGDDAADESGPPSTTASAGSGEASSSGDPSSGPPLSTGRITVGDVAFDLDVTCIAPGAAEVLAVGIGESADGERVEAYVQAFPDAPYVGLQVGDERIEPAFDGELALFLQDDAIRASAIRFVTDLDLATGDGEFVGLGSVEITCEHYGDESDLPATAFG